MKIVTLLLLGIVLVACHEDESKQDDKIKQEESVTEEPTNLPPIKEAFYEVVVSENKTDDYGYQILKDGKLVINQQTIPAIPGTSGFSSKEKAKKTGEFVLSKIKDGFFPPTVSPEELDSLMVL